MFCRDVLAISRYQVCVQAVSTVNIVLMVHVCHKHDIMHRFEGTKVHVGPQTVEVASQALHSEVHSGRD